MNKKRVLSLVLAILMIFSLLPFQSFADTVTEEQQKEELLKAELEKAADVTKYPNGLFEFLATSMKTSEKLSSVEFAIVRKGGTAGKASVTLKAIDVTAKYGEDYTLSVPKGLFTQTLPQNPDAKPLIDSFVNGTTGVGAVYEEQPATTQAGLEYVELPAQQLTKPGENKGLRAARDAFTGTTSERGTWREADQATKDAAHEAYDGIYEGVPGVTHTFVFEDGEYIKKIRFNTIDDAISEDEEQVAFALLNMEGGTLGEASNGFMNIEDNEEKEKVEFEMAEDQISVDRLTGCAEVTVRRTAGLYRYGMIQVGTAALSAQPEVDYEPVSAELRFVPGQETQKVKIPILNGTNDEELQFLVKLDPASPNLSSGGKAGTTVSIKASPVYLMQTQNENMRMMSSPLKVPSSTGWQTEDYNGKTYRVKTLTEADISEGEFVDDNGMAKIMHPVDSESDAYQGIKFKQLDLSEVELIRYEWSAEYETARGNWILSLFKPTSYMKIDSNVFWVKPTQISKSGRFSANWETCTLSAYDKLQKGISFYYKYGIDSNRTNSSLHIGQVKLYCKTYNFLLKALEEDPDAKLTPKIWTSATTSQNAPSEYVGSLAFAEDYAAATKAYGREETISLVPKFSEDFKDTSKVYLWGYKIERKGGLSGDKYYYIEGDKLNIKQLLENTLKDTKGKAVPSKEILMDNDTIVLLPVYKTRNAFVQINFDMKKGGMAENSFTSGQTLKIGMLDTLKLRAYAIGANAVNGYSHGDTNNVYYQVIKSGKGKNSVYVTYEYDKDAVPSSDRERELDRKDAGYGNTIIQDGKNTTQFSPITGIDINPALPGELDFKPQKTYSKLTVSFGISSLTVKMDPLSADETMDKGSVAYIPKEGSAQDGNNENPMVVSPIERNKPYTIIGSPKEGYRMTWKDWSGDLNGDGLIDDTEETNLEEYENIFDRKTVAGNFYNYVPNYDRPLIYYSFEPKPTGGRLGTVMGRVSLIGGNILESTGGQDITAGEIPIAGAEVNVNGHTVNTDKDGAFNIVSSDFATGEYQSLIITYKGINYTGHVNVNASTRIRIKEYDTFVPYNFTAYNKTKKEAINFQTINNQDANYRFRFDVKSNKQGIVAKKAIFRIYSKDGIQRGEDISVDPENGAFTLDDFNPATLGIVPGDSMTVQITDQNDNSYLEHNVGFYFKRNLSTFSLLSSFKSPFTSAIDMVGKIDTAFDLGLAGATSKYMDQTGKGGTEWVIKFGFQKDWEKSLSDNSDVKDGDDNETDDNKSDDNPAVEELKEAAKSSDESKMKEETDKSIDKENKEKKGASVTSDVKFGISTSLYLRMTVNEDPGSAGFGEAYFNEMIMSVTLSGAYSKKVERMTPVGVTVYVKMVLGGSITGMTVIEQYDYKKFYFNEDGEIDFSKAGTSDPYRDFTIYGKLIVQPYLTITAGAKIDGASLEITGSAKFDLNFTTTGSGSGKVTLDCDTTLKVLFFTYSWHIGDKSWDLFKYGVADSPVEDSLLGDTSYLYGSAEGYEIMPREYLNRRGGWQGGNISSLKSSSDLKTTPMNEQVLQTGVYPYPYTLLATIGENQQLLVFLDDNGSQDERNSTQLNYSIYNGTSWSIPQMVDNDNTADGLPWLYDMGDNVLVAWSSSVSSANAGDSAMDVLNNRNIKARFFSKAGKTFGEVQNVTRETENDYYSDSEPSIAYWKDDAGEENLMIVYKKTEYKATAGTGDLDAVVGDIVNPYYSTLAYRFYDFGSNTWDESGDLLDGYYGQGFINAAKYVDVDESDILITGDDLWKGYWSDVPSTSGASLKYFANGDPLIVDNNATGYKDYAVLAYILDLDENPGTTADRELFIQLYGYKDKSFYPAIRWTNDTVGQYDIEFAGAGDDVHMYYISDGDVMSVDIGYLINDGLLEYEIGGEPVFVQNKLKGVYKGAETVVRHKYDIRTDANGNETRENESPIDEFMVKANDSNVYIVWSESDVTYKDGIDPNSEAAALPENYYREHHIYAARQTIGDEMMEQIYNDDGVTPMTYPAVDESGNAIDYATIMDVNNEVGKVAAGDPVILKTKPAEWSDPVKITEGKGASYNDLDFEILPDGNLRVVFVKGFSEVTDVAGKPMPAEDVNKRTLMTADYNVNARKAAVEIEPVQIPKPNERIPVEIKIQNMSLSALNDIVVELSQIAGGTSSKVAEDTLRLRGGEETDISLFWQAPENLSDTKLQAVVKKDGEVLCSTEQSITAKSIIDIREASSEFDGRDKLKISGTAVNNGNINAEGEVILAEVSGDSIGSVNIGSLGVDEQKSFEFYADIKPGMFENIVNDDASVIAKMDMTVHSESGTGKSLSIERYASSQDIETINNISNFGLKAGSSTISGGISLNRGSKIIIEPALIYKDNTLPTPRIVYTSSNEEVADFSGDSGTLLGKNAGSATITAYAIPQISEILLSQDSFVKVDNIETLPEEAVKMRSFVVTVPGPVTDTGISTGLNPTVSDAEATIAGNAVTITTTVKASVDSSGKATASVTAAQINDAVSRAAEETARQGQTAAITIKVEAPVDAKSVETGIPTASVKKIADNGIEALSVSTPIANITFSDKALTSISAQAGESIKITASKVDSSLLSAETRQIVGDRPVFDFSVTSGEKTISKFGGQVAVSVPYTLKAGEDRNTIVIYYINDEGKLEIVSNCAYDPKTGLVTFRTDHFSKYAVGYNKVSFRDVAAKSWYSDAVSFIAARGITTGTGNGSYSPEEGLTRGQFLVMVMKAYGLAPDGNPADNFSDAGSTYYTGYLAAAKRLGISEGVGDNRYAPDKKITRQEMFTLIYNVLKLRGELPKGASGKSLTTYRDSDQIASWAREAMKLFAITGTVSGSNGRLSPKEVTTRAQMAQVLYNLLTK